MAGDLSQNSYGKSDVRVTRLFRRDAGRFDVCQMSVSVRLRGDFAASYLEGDNSKVVATDSIRNTIYVLARRHDFQTPEDFGHLVAEHFLSTYAHVQSAEVQVTAQQYERLSNGGTPHPFAFVGGGSERATFSILLDRGGVVKSTQGIAGLLVLKATDSEFVGYVRDEYTTLPEMQERIFSTVITAGWNLSKRPASYASSRAAVREAILGVFMNQHSRAVQETLLQMGRKALDACPEAAEISLALPNKHHLPMDLSPFGLDNPHMVFQPVDEPYGLIEGTVSRG